MKLASGWGASYNAVVAVGDTHRRREDRPRRARHERHPYRYSGNGKGSFGGRVKIATGRQGYKAVM
ncbi:hypothetical protein ACWCQN_41285 [Streptomyces sp. NPDC001984]|uniref:hypothetical protein n=1 Tax=Streptomyces sp. NPDC002619 TaxID=3364655 RepID=UPI0036A31194